MKREYCEAYTVDDTDRAESALLTVWRVLREFAADLVLVGGLVPRYICRFSKRELQPVTIDVDLGVSLALSSGQYETTTRRLGNAGFFPDKGRFQKQVDNARVFLDFLTDKPDEDAADVVAVDDMGVSAVYGVSRALSVSRTVPVSGRDLYDADVTEDVRVCEAGPCICLKLLAYHSRAKSKDVFDLVRCVRDYDGGPEEAARKFCREKGRNKAFGVAGHILEERFANERSKGPKQYADFCLGGVDSSADTDFLERQRVNEALDVSQLLMRYT